MTRGAEQPGRTSLTSQGIGEKQEIIAVLSQ